MTGARTFPSRNPATGQVIGEVPDCGEVELDAAVSAARRAVDHSGWSRDPELRRACVRRLRDALVENGDSMRALLTAEVGLPLSLTPGHYDDHVARLLTAVGSRHRAVVESPASR